MFQLTLLTPQQCTLQIKQPRIKNNISTVLVLFLLEKPQKCNFPLQVKNLFFTADILIILESLTEYSYTEWWKRQVDRAAKLIVCLRTFLSLYHQRDSRAEKLEHLGKLEV